MEAWGEEIRIRKTEEAADTRDDFENRAHFVNMNSVTYHHSELLSLG